MFPTTSFKKDSEHVIRKLRKNKRNMKKIKICDFKRKPKRKIYVLLINSNKGENFYRCERFGIPTT